MLDERKIFGTGINKLKTDLCLICSHVVVNWIVLEVTQRSDYFGNKNFMSPIRILDLKVVQQA